MLLSSHALVSGSFQGTALLFELLALVPHIHALPRFPTVAGSGPSHSTGFSCAIDFLHAYLPSKVLPELLNLVPYNSHLSQFSLADTSGPLHAYLPQVFHGSWGR